MDAPRRPSGLYLNILLFAIAFSGLAARAVHISFWNIKLGPLLKGRP